MAVAAALAAPAVTSAATVMAPAATAMAPAGALGAAAPAGAGVAQGSPRNPAAQEAGNGEGRNLIASSPVAGEVRIDGRMDEAAWSAAAVVPLRYEVSPGDNVSAPVETECRVMHDLAHLYLGCVALDPWPSAVRAYVTARDAVAGQDRIEFTLVPFDDGRRGYRFSVTPLGTQFDAQVLPDASTGMPDDPAWNAAWSSAGRLGPEGYTIEAAIPFSELRFPEDGGAWGFRVQRYWPRGVDVRLRSEPWDRRDACDLCQTARLTGLSGVRPGGALRIAPTVTASRSESDAVAATDGDVGADLLWTPQASTAVGVAVNPDFSHIEADDAQLDANERFALLIPERRPFFLEGADLFATPIRLFFSRTIADPDAAAKLTAKWGSTGVGLILARDAGATVVLPGREGSRLEEVAGGSSTAVVRVRQDVGRSSSAGFMATSRTAGDYSNHAASVDARLQPLPTVTAAVQVVGSRTDDAVGVVAGVDAPFTGWGASASLRHGTREWIATAQGYWRSDDLRLDAGFVPQVGVYGIDLGLRREILAGRDSWYQRISFAAGGFDGRNGDGGLMSRGIWIGGEYQGPSELFVTMYVNAPEQLAFDRRIYDVATLYTFASIRPVTRVRINGWAMVGRGVDFATGQAADRVDFEPRAEARIGRRIELSLAHPYRRLDRNGETLLLARAGELRALYGITARASLRLIGQIESVTRPETGESLEHLLQALFSYEVDPQSVIRLGVARTGGDDIASASLVFLKVGYAWRP